ncbi:hypothetical protein A6V39_04520 [Candidatus Mycoplasma haematobovis]|uniref:Uncharacterized protein n=1 Tax=Candidatus Mycoplasma haematobovis TaxID=432608 RepID=A0A1A9QEM9_9MOLU|nr:hypothetical protein A6V39_04520 [Candidatus Mycoplasma haematobovis]
MVFNKKVFGLVSLVTGGIATVASLWGNDLMPSLESKPDNESIVPAKAGSIASKLQSQGVKLLGGLNTDFKKWEVIMAKYEKHASSKDLLITLNGEQTPRWNNLNIEDLSKWCNEKSESDYEDDQNRTFKQVKEFCSVPTTKDYLERDKKTLISGDNGWANAVRKYTDAVKTTRITVAELGTNIVEPKVLEGWCTKSSEGEYEQQKYEWIVKFCTDQ